MSQFNLKRSLRPQSLAILVFAWMCMSCSQALFEQAPQEQSQKPDVEVGVPDAPDEDVPQIDLPDDEVVRQACTGGNYTEQVYSVQFDDPVTLVNNPADSCNWGMANNPDPNGNLDRRDGFLQSRIEQSYTFQAPAGSVICEMNFEFAQQNYHFDDYFFLVFDGVILAASNQFDNKFEEVDGLRLYSWQRVRGSEYKDSQNIVYCPGSDDGQSQCSFPKHDESGAINLNYSSELIQKLMSRDRSRSSHEFRMVATGDNDDDDCQHSPVSFNLRVRYAKVSGQ